MLTCSAVRLRPNSCATPNTLSPRRLACSLTSHGVLRRPLSARYAQVRCETLKSKSKKQTKPRGIWQGYKAYSTLLSHAWTLGPKVLWKIIVVGIQALGQGIHAAGAEALFVAVQSKKAAETANLSAEIVRLGWTSFACRVVIVALRRGYLESALAICAVLIQQQDVDVLLETTQGMTEIGGKEEADELKQALTDQGYQLGWFFGKLANQRVPQNRDEAVQAAKDVINTTAGAVKGAMAGVAESVKPKTRIELEGGLA